jgi:hypothetical protein
MCSKLYAFPLYVFSPLLTSLFTTSPLWIPNVRMALPTEAVKGVVATVVLLVLASVVVGLRFVARARNKAFFKLDDWMILITLVC